MPHPRTVVVALAVTFVSMAFALEFMRLPDGAALGVVLQAEITHLVAHTLLYGGLAAALAAWWFPASALDDDRGSLARRAIGAALCFLAVAVAQELAQSLSRHHFLAREEFFDLAVDLTAATAGLIAWSWRDDRRAVRVARALGVVLHPGVLGPLGVFAITWAALRNTRVGVTWTTVATLAVTPVAAVWLVGLRRGWFRDADLSVRAERPPFLLSACLAALALTLLVRATHAPAVVQELCLAGLAASVGVTAATLAGLKVSGHVAVPVGVLGLLSAHSARGLWPFAVAALALSWARVREGRHTPREVLGAWGLAGASALCVRL
ncbi:MAG: hypothetical protein U0325_23860 [Polyangiales bacterium]